MCSISSTLRFRHSYELKSLLTLIRVSHGVPVYSQACTGTLLYCLVTEANVCEQLG